MAVITTMPERGPGETARAPGNESNLNTFADTVRHCVKDLPDPVKAVVEYRLRQLTRLGGGELNEDVALRVKELKNLAKVLVTKNGAAMLCTLVTSFPNGATGDRNRIAGGHLLQAFGKLENGSMAPRLDALNWAVQTFGHKVSQSGGIPRDEDVGMLARQILFIAENENAIPRDIAPTPKSASQLPAVAEDTGSLRGVQRIAADRSLRLKGALKAMGMSQDGIEINVKIYGVLVGTHVDRIMKVEDPTERAAEEARKEPTFTNFADNLLDVFTTAMRDPQLAEDFGVLLRMVKNNEPIQYEMADALECGLAGAKDKDSRMLFNYVDTYLKHLGMGASGSYLLVDIEFGRSVSDFVNSRRVQTSEERRAAEEAKGLARDGQAAS